MDSLHQKKKNLVKGTLIYSIGNFGTKILSFLIVPLYTFYILPEELGYYDIILATISLLTPIVSLQITDATYKRIADDYENSYKYISITYLLLLMCSIFVSIIVLCSGSLIVPLRYRNYLVAMLLCQIWFISIQRILRALNQQKIFVISGILQSVFFLVSIVICVSILKQGVFGLCISYIIAHILSIVYVVICCRKVLPLRLYYSNAELKSMLGYSVPLIPNAMSWWLINSSEKYLILFFLGTAANGIYSVTCKFPTIVQTVNNLFYSAWQDMIIREKAGQERNKLFTEVFEIYYKLSFGMVLFLIPATKLMLPLIVDSAYITSADYVSFLYLGVVFQGFASFFGINYLVESKTIEATSTSLLAAIINLIIDIALLSSIGLQAASISTFTGFLIMWFVRVKRTEKYTKVNISIFKFSSLFVSSLIMAILCIRINVYFNIVLIIVGFLIFVTINRNIIMKILKKSISKIKK